MIQYGKSRENTRTEGLPGSEWGPFERYLAIGDDGYATRQVDVYRNGFALRYDRTHYIDSYSMLADIKFTDKWKKWWPNSSTIEAMEFEKVWNEAASSPANTLQERSSHPQGMPKTPPWLKR